MSHITIIGLGPGDPGQLTKAAWDLLHSTDEVYLRTSQHPTAAAFPASLAVHSFDSIYEGAEDFAAVYQEIAARVVALGRRPAGVVYAVPGDPAVGEATTWLIRDAAAAEGIPLRVVSGVSFVEPACWALGLDPLERDGLQVVDAMVVAASHAPPFDTSRPALLAQCYSRTLASDVKLTLLHSFEESHLVTVVQAAGTADQSLRRVPLFELDRSPSFDHLTSLYVPPAGPQAAYSRLEEIVARLRAPDGCPWDREQTLQTLRKDLQEEAYELLEALDHDDDAKIGEELGDLSLLVAMLAQIAAEEERFKWPWVMEQVCDKLIRRHPHVFGDVEVSSVEDVLANWAAIKGQEAEERRRKEEGGRRSEVPELRSIVQSVRSLPEGQRSGSSGVEEDSGREGLLDSVPKALPALLLASKYQSRLSRAGIDPDLAGADPVGLALWRLVAEARAAGVDAETALREVCVLAAESAE